MKFSVPNIFIIIAKSCSMMDYILQQKHTCKVSFLILGFCFNTIMLIPELHYVFSNSYFIHTTIIKLQVSHFIFVIINLAASASLPSKKMISFLIQANIIGLLFSFLMTLLCIVNIVFNIMPVENDVLILMIFLLMTIEYKRMMRKIDLHKNYPIIITDMFASILFIAYLVLG